MIYQQTLQSIVRWSIGSTSEHCVYERILIDMRPDASFREF